jgi:hypothetical protein
MKTKRAIFMLSVLAACGLICVAGLGIDRWLAVRQAQMAVAGAAAPRLEPDYAGIVMPPNICPLNFKIAEPGTQFYVVARGTSGEPISVLSGKPAIAFPKSAWRRLLEANPGGSLYFDICARQADKTWRRFASVTNLIARDRVDSHLIYRKIHPLHNTWNEMGIYQRDLTSFKETPILENKLFGKDCCHCHSVWNQDSARFSLDIRSSKYGNSLLMVTNERGVKIGGTVGFTTWHPSGRIMVCSFGQPRLLLCGARSEMREIVDLEDSLGYLPDGGVQVKRVPKVHPEKQLATFPTWSPEGRYLYYCATTNLWKIPGKTRNNNFNEIKFDLMRIPYEVERDQWGEPEPVVCSRDTGKSAVQPRISPDGRWLSFILCDYGCWPVYHAESDLYIVDLRAGRTDGKFTYRRAELNSPECESWHAWSSNSRWMVVKSKRGTPLFGRPYLSHVDEDGHCSKPFVVPQRDPAYYDSCLITYTMPTLACGPVMVDEAQLARAIKTPATRALIMPPRDDAEPSHEGLNPPDAYDEGAGSQQ